MAVNFFPSNDVPSKSRTKRTSSSSRSSAPSNSFSYTRFFFISILCFTLQPAFALRNITVDDSDSRVSYTGTWEHTPTFEEYSAGGGHMMTFKDPNASATFKFQGTAVHLSYPLWPYEVSTGWISLDGQAPVRLSLRDPNHSESDGGRATTPSSVLYSVNNLDPQVEHTLLVSVVDTDAFVVLDSIIYTELEAGDEPVARNVPSSSLAAPTSSLTSSPPTSSSNSSSTKPSPPAKQSQTRTVSIAIGIVIAVIALLSIPLIIYLCSRRRQKKEHDQWRQEAYQDWNAAYGLPERKPSELPIYNAHTTVPQSPYAPASPADIGTISYLLPTPPPAPTPSYHVRARSKDITPQDERYFEQMRTAHSHMMATKSSQGSLVVPVSPPATAAIVPRRDAQRSQAWGRQPEREVSPVVQYHPPAPARKQSIDSITTAGLSYASERTIVNAPQVPQQASSSTAQQPQMPNNKARDLALEEERKENERYRLRLRNARQSMMTVNTVSAPPAYEDASYPPPPPIPQHPYAARPNAQRGPRSANDRSSTLMVPNRSGQHRNHRMTKISMMQNPWEQSGSDEEGEFGGKTLVETSPIRGGFSSAGRASYSKAFHTLAPSSG